jgi:hypothetical protein
MADAKEKWVVREGKDWLELQKVDPEGCLWLVTHGTLAAVGDIVRFPRLGGFGGAGADDLEAPLSPFEAEIVVDTVTQCVLLPESGSPFHPGRLTLELLETLEAAGLKDQARIVREWLGPAAGGSRARRHAA